ncbi:MAG: ATP-binding cassette domain-containing protein [Clostridium sp.]|nr:ATP-binding cassette domain-containing protein [Acetatifactor muris]MCM1525811.1 ATP-binding cassette domain-containing protein [Bacteroides sp.]MCM1564310.1 ATP-binding cassette domain-containing protein [Clostridium sp.]
MENNAVTDNREIAIEVTDVRKKFRSYRDKATTFKERFLNPSRGRHEDVTVLKGISFRVRRGEAVGIIGRNGCGKSTTLKLLTRILYPNEGRIRINGRVSSLIELGAGFHPDMTGRENIYINASIFGITRKEVERRLNDIIRFSELEEFIDNPVRTYSSGMYMRLAFAVAINVDADVLLIDEILAVGDSAFQKKCFEKLKEIKRNGTTIVIVSHSMEQMYKICDRLIWLEDGLIRDEGIPKFIGEEYLAAMEGRRLSRADFENRQKKEELEQRIREEQERQRAEQEKAEKERVEKEQKSRDEAARQEKIAQMQRERQALLCNESLKDICSFYRSGARRQTDFSLSYTHVTVYDQNGTETNLWKTGETYEIQLAYKADCNYKDIRFVIGLTREDGVYCYGSYKDISGELPSQGILTFRFVNALLKGHYVLDLWIEGFDQVAYDSIYSLMAIDVDTDPYIERGILTMKHQWETGSEPGDSK